MSIVLRRHQINMQIGLGLRINELNLSKILHKIHWIVSFVFGRLEFLFIHNITMKQRLNRSEIPLEWMFSCSRQSCREHSRENRFWFVTFFLNVESIQYKSIDRKHFTLKSRERMRRKKNEIVDWDDCPMNQPILIMYSVTCSHSGHFGTHTQYKKI